MSSNGIDQQKVEATGYVGNVTYSDAPERQSIVAEYGFAINNLSDRIDTLAARLAPVLALYGPGAEKNATAEPAPPTSEARTQLGRLNHEVGRLYDLLERLEV